MSNQNTEQSAEYWVPEDSSEQLPQPKRGLRRFLLPGAVGLLLLGGVGWILFNRVILPLLMAGQMPAPSPISVPLGPVKATTIEDSSDYAATLDSRQSITVQPKVSGRISAIYVKAGDRVQAGAKLLQIDADEQRAQVASRRAGVSTAAAEVESARADVANAEGQCAAQSR
jgi:multidrug efflux pump subunit AcrA (membrane-fusion protein)